MPSVLTSTGWLTDAMVAFYQAGCLLGQPDIEPGSQYCLQLGNDGSGALPTMYDWMAEPPPPPEEPV